MQSWKFKKIEKILASPLAPSGLGAPARFFFNFQLCIERFFVRSKEKYLGNNYLNLEYFRREKYQVSIYYTSKVIKNKNINKL